MKTFVFVCEEHQEFGCNGWRIKSQPDFDPLSGMAVAHDCLEHFSDSANPADEFMALGASLWIRDESYHAAKGRYETNPGVHIASDMPDILRHVRHEGYRLPSAPVTRATDEYLEGYIAAMFSAFNKNRRDESDADELKLSAEERRTIISYIRIGYRRAITRYRAQQWKAQEMFNRIERAADDFLKHAEHGSELTVHVDFKALTCRVFHEEYPE